MAVNVSVADLTTMRDNLVTAYTTLCNNPTKTYQLSDRMFTYEDRADIYKEISHLTRIILMRTGSTKALGSNRVDLQNWS